MEVYNVFYKNEQGMMIPIFEGGKLRKALLKLFPLINISEEEAKLIMKYYFNQGKLFCSDKNMLYLKDAVSQNMQRLQRISLSDIIEQLGQNEETYLLSQSIIPGEKSKRTYTNGMKFTDELLKERRGLVSYYLDNRIHALSQTISAMYGVSCDDNACYYVCEENDIRLQVALQNNINLHIYISPVIEKNQEVIGVNIRNRFWSDVKRQIIRIIAENVQLNKQQLKLR